MLLLRGAFFFTAALYVLAVCTLVTLDVLELAVLVALCIELAISAAAMSRTIWHEYSPSN